MNLLDLPNEMLIMICSYLNGEERKRLCTVCCRFEELFFHPRGMERWVLRLNHIQYMEYPLESWITFTDFIGADVLKRSNRQYRTVRMALPSSLNATEQSTVFNRLRTIASKLTSVKQLCIDDIHMKQMHQLIYQFSRFLAGLERLTVSILVTTRDINPSRMQLTLPNLRSIVWIETKDDAYDARKRPKPEIHLTAPVLERALVRNVKLRTFSYNHSLLVLQAFDQLRELDVQVSTSMFALLSRRVLPNLVELSLHWYSTKLSANWERIARNLPALRTLILFYAHFDCSDRVALRTLPASCPHLAELHLNSMDLTELFTSRATWERIHTLHIHDCFTMLPAGARLSVVLPAVRDLCLDLQMAWSGRMQFYLPEVRTLGLFQVTNTIDLMEAPKLERLSLTQPANLSMSFLHQPLPYLRHFIMELDEFGSFCPDVCPLMAQLQCMTIISWLDDAKSLDVEKLNELQPNLRALRLFGMNQRPVVSGNAFRSLFNLRQLESLLISNIKISELPSNSIEIPETLQDVRVRSLHAPNDFPLLPVDEAMHPRVRIEMSPQDNGVEYSCNPHLLPNLRDVELLRYDRCLNKWGSWLWNAP